jgi:2-phosphosulfolactate phosphatase
MKVDLIFCASLLDELSLRDKNVVVIDVLRSSTTIATALNNGAREIIPVDSIEKAVKVSGSLFGDVTLRGGERNGRIIQGFNLGNSPDEYSEAIVKGKSIIFCTTNGSLALARSRHAKNLLVGSFVNMKATVDFLAALGEDAILVCAGRPLALGGFSLEDTVCAGMMIAELQARGDSEVVLSDTSLAARSMYKSHGRSIPKMLKLSEHGRYLGEIGFGSDLELCGRIDSVPVLPVWKGTGVKLWKDQAAAAS